MKRYYLAYGSNLNIAQMQFRCPDAVMAGTAVIPDYDVKTHMVYKSRKHMVYIGNGQNLSF